MGFFLEAYEKFPQINELCGLSTHEVGSTITPF